MLGPGRQPPSPDQCPRPPAWRSRTSRGADAYPTCLEGPILRRIFRPERGLHLPSMVAASCEGGASRWGWRDAWLPRHCAQSAIAATTGGSCLLTPARGPCRSLPHSVGWVGTWQKLIRCLLPALDVSALTRGGESDSCLALFPVWPDMLDRTIGAGAVWSAAAGLC